MLDDTTDRELTVLYHILERQIYSDEYSGNTINLLESLLAKVEQEIAVRGL